MPDGVFQRDNFSFKEFFAARRREEKVGRFEPLSAAIGAATVDLEAEAEPGIG
jgi:hypothetical protein